jgi:hypothetical protein
MPSRPTFIALASISLANQKRLPAPRRESIMLIQALHARSRLLPKGMTILPYSLNELIVAEGDFCKL